MKKQFNIIVSGVGGQGIITLLMLLSKAALNSGFDVKTSELHGLSQRGGSVKTHIKIGEKISSPLIIPGEADLIIGLEPQEALRTRIFANPNTVFVVNSCSMPTIDKEIGPEKIEKYIKQTSKNIHLIDATSIVEKELNNSVVAGMFLLAYAVSKKLIPLSMESIEKSIEKVINPKYIQLNKKAIQLAKDFRI